MARTKLTLGGLLTACLVLFLSVLSSEQTLLSVPPPTAQTANQIGVYLTSFALTKADVLRGILEARRSGKLNTLVINVKNMHGEITYDSAVPLARQIGASTGRLDFREILPILRAEGFYLIARQVVFFDPYLARHLGYPKDWVPAHSPEAVAYNLAIAEEVADLGFDEIQFDYIRYEDAGDLVSVYADRYAAISAFLEQASQRLAGRVALSADLFGRVLWPWNERRIDPIGQSLEDISTHVSFVSPMVYPSHYAEDTYRNDPYAVVRDALSAGKQRIDTPIRPFLQAFDMALPSGMSLETYIAEQIRAADEMNADGYLFWHPACEYETLYRVLR